jgi:hypothetical protein
MPAVGANLVFARFIFRARPFKTITKGPSAIKGMEVYKQNEQDEFF